MKLIKIHQTVALLSRRLSLMLFQEHAQFIPTLGPLQTQFPLLGVLAFTGLASMVGRKMTPQNVHTLIPGYVNLLDQKDFAM